MKIKLVDLVSNELDGKFEPVGGSRDVYYCGEFGYWYTGKFHPARETPAVIQNLLDVIKASPL